MASCASMYSPVVALHHGVGLWIRAVVLVLWIPSRVRASWNTDDLKFQPWSEGSSLGTPNRLKNWDTRTSVTAIAS